MSNRVYTYTRITELKNAPFFREIAALPQITMSEEMRLHMCREMRVFRANTRHFAYVQQVLFPGWNSGAQRFACLTVLNRFVRREMEQTKDRAEREWLSGCKKNLVSAIHNMIRLEEAGVRPEDIHETDRDMLLFVRMWKQLETDEPGIRTFRANVEQYKDPEVFEQKISRVFQFHGEKKILWHGFQYLTPIQQFLYDCFVRAGYEMYALIQCDERYPYANEIWNHLYNGKNGFPPKEGWIREKNENYQNPLGEIFETGEKVAVSNVRIIRYRNTVDFIGDMDRLKKEGEEFYIYCADDLAANQLLKDYYPERYEVRNLLSYPIGQFIYALHNMWDEKAQGIVLDADGLRICFASGWLSAKGRSSRNYTEDLERLLPYFEGCHTLEEWKHRSKAYRAAYEGAVCVFSAEGERKDGVSANPLQSFGVFSVPRKRMEQVLTIMEELIRMAEELFEDKEPVSIHTHMSRLDAMLYMNDGMPEELYIREKDIVRQIFSALENENVRDFLCYPGDLAGALLSFMSGKTDEEEIGKRQLRNMVFNLYQVDSAPLSAKGRVHICMADITKLPGAAGRYSWPVDEQLLRKISEESEDTYLSNWIENDRLITLANRFYIVSALNNEQVEISWIQKQGEKLFSPSPYITLLEKLSDAKVEENEERSLTLQKVMEILPRKRLDEQFDFRRNSQLHRYDDRLAYALCPMRYIYSSVLAAGGAYRNEYQQNMAMIRLLQVIRKLAGDQYSLEEIAEQVFALFSGIRKAEKRQMIDDALRFDLPEQRGGFAAKGEQKVTDYRLNLLFPDKGCYESAKRQAELLMSPEGRKGISFDPTGQGELRNCEYCPHEGYCPESFFGLDYKGERE